jgi:hypothetical protein
MLLVSGDAERPGFALGQERLCEQHADASRPPGGVQTGNIGRCLPGRTGLFNYDVRDFS